MSEKDVLYDNAITESGDGKGREGACAPSLLQDKD